MKKFLTFFTALLFAGSLMATEVTFTKADFAGQGTANTGSEVSATNGGVTFTYSKGYCADESLRCYANGNLSVTASATIEKINFTTTGGKTGGLDSEVTVNATSYSVANLASQARFTEIKVTLSEGGGDSGDDPVYTIAGSSTAAFGTSWDPSITDNEMVKQTDGTYKWEKSGVEVDSDIEFKVVEGHAWGKEYPTDNYILKIAESGSYTITITFDPNNDNTVNATANKTGDAVVIPEIKLNGTFTGTWAQTDAFALADDQKTASLKLTLAKETFEFGVMVGGSWSANAATITRENPSTTGINPASGNNMFLDADVAGEYTFTWTFESKTLAVTFPEKSSGDDPGEGAYDATMAAGTNGATAEVNGKTAIKVGTSSKGGDMTIKVGAGATKLTFYAAAWNGVNGLSLNITADGVTATPASVDLTTDTGISGNSPFTLSGDEANFKHEVVLAGVENETTLTLTSSIAKRFVVWGATYETGEGGEGGDEIVVDTPVISGEASFEEATTVTITCATDDAVIYYTLDGTTPSDASTLYEQAFKIEETTTIKAIAILDEASSAVASKTFTKVEPLTDPTNCAEAREAALSVSANDELYNNGKEYTIVGYVTSIKTAYNDTYHNISFWMADTKDGGEVIQAYRAACASADDAPKVGDKVSVTGKLTKYNTTPEFAAACTFTIIERAEDEGGDDPEPLTDPTNCAEAREAALSVSGNNVPYNDGKEYTIEGYVTSIATAYSDTYHNISFWMADAADGGEVLEAFRATCASEDAAPKVGDKVSVTGKLTQYNGTPQFAAACTFTIIERAEDEGGDDPEPLTDPTNCAEAREAALSVSGNNVPYNDGKEYTIEGYVTSIATAYSDTYHNISFWMADAADGGEVLEAFRATCASEDAAPKVGDKVSVTGKLTQYNGTPQFAAGCTVEIKERVAAPENLGPKTIAEFLELKNFKDTCELTGKVTNISSTKYGNFDLIDNTGSVYVYGLLTPSGEQQKFAELDVEVNDTITIKAVYYEYNESPQAYNAVFKEIVRKAVYSVAGSAAVFGDNWNQLEGNEMTRQEDGTYTLELTDLELAADSYEYKVVVNHAWNNGEAADNSVLTIETSGKYKITFTYNPTTTETSAEAALIEAEVIVPSVQLAATFNNWAPADMTAADDKLTASITYSLVESSLVDSIKVLVATNWKGNGQSITRQNNTVEGLTENIANMLLDVDQTGDYIFTWTFAGNKLTVTYPELVIDNCAKAAKAALSVSANNELYNEGAEYTLRGYVTAIATSYKEQYNNMSFWMADTKDGGQVLEAYYVIPESADNLPIVGDYVEVTGQLTKFKTTPEFASGCTCKIIEKSDNPRNLGEKTIAEFLEMKNTKDTCILTGVVSNIQSTLYGNFDLEDETGKVYIYGLLTADGLSGQFESMGIGVGDTLTLKAVYYENVGTPEAKNAIFVSVSKGIAPVNLGEVTIEEFLSMKNTKDTCILTGVVANMVWEDKENKIPNKYGNFDLVDAENPEISVYIYGLLTADGEAQKFQDMGIEEGDILTLKGVYLEFNGKAEVKNAIFISVQKHEAQTIEINAPTSIEYRDAVATDGWWLLVGEDEKLSFKLSNINEITQAIGTYTAAELDPDYAFVVMKSAPEDTIRFTDGQIVLDYEISGTQDITTVKGTLVGEDGNNYVFNIEFSVEMDINYYLVGSFNNWEPSVDYQFKASLYVDGEYTFTTNLAVGNQLKVVAIQGEVETWYPGGQDNNYIVDAAHAGEMTIYFRPEGNAEWENFHEGGYFYIDAKLEPQTIGIEIADNVRYYDHIATDGYWILSGWNDTYIVQLSNLNKITEAQGTYTFEDLDADYTYIQVRATGGKINIVDGSITVSIEDATGALVAAGQLKDDEDNIYNIRLVYVEPKADETVELNINGSLSVEAENAFMISGTDETTNIYVQLYIYSLEIEGNYNRDNLSATYSAVWFDRVENIYTDIYTADIEVVGNEDGSYTTTAELLCYNNTKYIVTITTEAGTTTGVDDIRAARLHKYIENGRLIIERDGVRYDITGQMIR